MFFITFIHSPSWHSPNSHNFLLMESYIMTFHQNKVKQFFFLRLQTILREAFRKKM